MQMFFSDLVRIMASGRLAGRAVKVAGGCVLTPGYNPEVWRQPDFQTLVRNGLRWLTKVKR